mmetsp:Transcript_7615/g.23092  ORF Transcript_7615/g.23092 Transcript_7615/m.23092 type:complete len:209 (-) Transcript_7615:268-894(-)
MKGSVSKGLQKVRLPWESPGGCGGSKLRCIRAVCDECVMAEGRWWCDANALCLCEECAGRAIHEECAGVRRGKHSLLIEGCVTMPFCQQCNNLPCSLLCTEEEIGLCELCSINYPNDVQVPLATSKRSDSFAFEKMDFTSNSLRAQSKLGSASSNMAYSGSYLSMSELSPSDGGNVYTKRQEADGAQELDSAKRRRMTVSIGRREEGF